jgi:hypothetical protein
MFGVDVLLASQVTRISGASPERKLLAAMVEDALDLVRKHPGTPKGQELRGQAVAWFASEDRAPAFAFVNVAAILGLDVSAVRARLPLLAPIAPRMRTHAFACRRSDVRPSRPNPKKLGPGRWPEKARPA